MSSSGNKPAICTNKSCRNPGVKKCIKCHWARYCSRECQVAHWKQHKPLCIVTTCPEKCARLQRARRYHDSGDNLSRRRQYDEALVEYRKALLIFQDLVGENHEFIAACYSGSGSARSGKGQFEEALVEHQKALAIFREVYGEDHEHTAGCYEYIGNLFLERGEPDDALIGYGKALAIRLRLIGESHTDIALSYCNIGLVLERKGQYNEALVSLHKAHEIFVRVDGENHPKTTRTCETIERVSRMKQEQERH